MFMDIQFIRESFVSLVKRNYLSVIVGFLGLIFFSYGLIALSGSSQSQSGEIVFEAGKDSLQSETASVSGASVKSLGMLIDVEGAAVSPGVYSLSLGARVKDALIAAGGLSGDADRGWITKNLNLAAKLTDGAKIYAPKISDALSDLNNANNGSVNQGGSQSKININAASSVELDSLPGIGQVTAEKIIRLRPYSEINDLLSKKAVSSKVFEQIKEKITAY